MLNRVDRADLKDRVFNWNEIGDYSDVEAQKEILYETPNTVGAIWRMKPGQELPIHSHKAADDIWVVIEGYADYYPNHTDHFKIGPGDIILARPGECHGMTNNYDEDFLMLGFAGPTPIGFIEEEHQFKSDK